MALASVTKTFLTQALASRSAAREIIGLLNSLSGSLATVTFAVAVEAANNIDVTIQVKDEWGNNVTSVHALDVLLVATAAALAFNANAYTITATAGNVVEPVAAKVLKVLTTAAGLATIRLNNVAAVTCFMAVQLNSSQLSVSPTITHV